MFRRCLFTKALIGVGQWLLNRYVDVVSSTFTIYFVETGSTKRKTYNKLAQISNHIDHLIWMEMGLSDVQSVVCFYHFFHNFNLNLITSIVKLKNTVVYYMSLADSSCCMCLEAIENDTDAGNESSCICSMEQLFDS